MTEFPSFLILLYFWRQGLTQAGLEVVILLPQASQVLGLQACDTTPRLT
jgi:hypothetical protein